MNKKDLVKYVSNTIMVTEEDAGTVLSVIFDGIKKALEEGEKVKIREFGTFFVQRREPRRAYNPIDQSPLDIPARNGIKFKASKILTEKVN